MQSECCILDSLYSGIANIGSKIFGGIKHAAQCVALTLHKVIFILSGPVRMIHPGIGGTQDSGDFAFSAESGTIWMFEANWYNSGDIVPDQVTPASDAIPQLPIVNGSARTSNEYTRGDHQHPLQVSTALPGKDTAIGEEDVATTYARSDNMHHENLSVGVPIKDIGTGTVGTSNIQASDTNQHPLNVDPTIATDPLINAIAAANDTSDYYCRNHHVDSQQLTYDGNITATKFIKTGELAKEILCANGDITAIADNYITIATDLTITGIISPSNQIKLSNNRLMRYSAGNPILLGVNSTGTEGGFYSDAAKLYWRAKPITMGSVPP
ncbi:MAG: hypothetical protein EZS28_003715 [Streblomastix strix]|uniref:Uncharacterized protein n=1 Tax=Streblomastix strix TaxID=222440 RepID=A0A5J4X1Z4_9EUKA|nr:MAG: hypothetical protein EZS28_003715 [Streblomastix strix]